MSSESPAIIAYSSLGIEVSVGNGGAVASSAQPGLMIDGYNYSTGLAQLLAVDSSGHPIVVGSGVAGTPAGGVLTVQGATSMTAISVSNATAANFLAEVGGLGATGSAPTGNPVYVGTLVNSAAPVYSNGNFNALSLTTGGQLRIDGVYPTATATGSAPDMQQVGGIVTTAAPTYTTGQINPLSLDTAGNLRVTGADGTFPVTQSGTWTLNADGYVTTSAPTYTNGTTNYLSLTTAGALRVDGSGVTQPVSGTVTVNAGTGNFNNASIGSTAASPPGSATYIGASVTTAAPTYTTGQMDPLSLTTAGLLRIDGVYPVNATTPTSDAVFVAGAVTTAAPTYTTGQMSALSLDTSGNLRVLATVSGTIATTAAKSSTGTLTSVAASASSVTLLASNANRLGAAFFNDSNSICFIAMSSTAASNTAYTIKLMPNSYTDLSIDYTGQINAIWNTTNGSMRVTEWTP